MNAGLMGEPKRWDFIRSSYKGQNLLKMQLILWSFLICLGKNDKLKS